jgi:pentatricopeptide repeat domain-containing protein 2
MGGSRTLFAPSAVGLDGYERQRERTNAQFSGMTDKFRDKMREFTVQDTKNMIFTEDLKNMVHLTENKPEDLELVVEMMKR